MLRQSVTPAARVSPFRPSRDVDRPRDDRIEPRNASPLDDDRLYDVIRSRDRHEPRDVREPDGAASTAVGRHSTDAPGLNEISRGQIVTRIRDQFQPFWFISLPPD